MNIEPNRRIELARTEEEMYEKLEILQTEGYAESDIHVISKENTQLNTLNRHSEVSTHEAGTFMDKFKSWFSGEDAITEGLKRLDLSDIETERYAQEVARGSIVLYTDLLTHADDPMHVRHGSTTTDPEFTDTVGTDVVQNRFMGTEEPLSDETVAIEREEEITRKNHSTIDNSLTAEEKKYGAQSPGADPNLGPAAYGSELEDEENITPEQYEERLERQRKLDEISATQRLY